MESVKTALRVLELVGESGQAGVSDLARATGEPKSTVQRNLVTLHEAGWIRPVEEGKRRRWTLSPRVLLLARRLQPVERLRGQALAVMERLRDRTLETIHLTLRDGNLVVLIERLDSPRTLRTVRQLGDAAPLHMNSTGKSILAHLSDAEQAAYLKQRLSAPTPRTLVDPEALSRDLTLIRQRGFAFNNGELDLEVRAVGASIRLETGEPIAAVSISCPAARLPDSLVEAYGALVRDAAADISQRLTLT
jgi:IclR family transcriptional regulator, acetate operon repressor